MKILVQNDYIELESALNAPEISDEKIKNANRIINILNKKVEKINLKENTKINLIDYIHNKAIEKIDFIKNLNCSNEEKIKKIFNYIHWYYVAISWDFNEDWIKISIPDIFRQITDNPEIIENFEIIICWDNPWKKEFKEDRWFNPNASAWSILNTILYTNSINDEKVLFFNKTFISTNITKDLSKIKNKKLVKNTIEFNAKVLNILNDLLNIPVLVLWWQNESLFNIFFDTINNNIKLAPHTSMYKIFWENKKIIGWNKKFNIFKEKYKEYDIFSEKWYLSLKKINELWNIWKNILIDYFKNVILN